MTRAIRLHEIGTPEVLKLEPVEVGEPGPSGVRPLSCQTVSWKWANVQPHPDMATVRDTSAYPITSTTSASTIALRMTPSLLWLLLMLPLASTTP